MDKTTANTILDKAISLSSADRTEITIEETELALTRLAENAIHQNMARTDFQITARIAKDGKSGIASRNQPDEATAKELLAVGLAAAAESQPGEVLFASAQPIVEQTAPASTPPTPTDRASALKVLVDAAKAKGITTAGEYRVSVTSTGVAVDKDVRQYGQSAFALLSATATTPKGGTAYVHSVGRDGSAIDASALSRKLIDRAVATEDPVALPPGPYTVILEPPAVGQLLILLSFMGFGAKTMGRSFMTGKIGEKITSEKITIIDDVHDPLMIGLPFDYQGMPRKKVSLIEKGIAKGVVSDLDTAKRLGEESTGHALPATNGFGPYPKAMVMSGGDSSIDEMITSTDRGVLISHFWYVNYANPMKTQVTGTTYEGAMMIESGKLTKGIRSTRFVQSILDALSNVEAISKEQQLYQQFSSFMLVPAMKVKEFTFVPEG